MKILLISHEADMDGLAPSILAKIVYEEVDLIFTSPDDITSVIKEIIDTKKYKDYDKVIITDLGLKDEAYDLINNSTLKNMIMHFDHHETKNTAPWSIVKIKDGEYSYSAASIFYDYLLETYKDNKILKKNSLKEFIDAVRLYDNFEHVKFNNPLGLKLTNIFVNTERYYLINSLLDRFVNKDDKHFTLTKEEEDICDRCEKELNDYLEYCDKNLIRIKFLDYNVGFSISTKYRSSVGNYLANKYKDELDFILIADYNRESFSLRGVTNVNLGEVSSRLGGGGHEHAAGFPMNDDTLRLTKPYFTREIMEKLKKSEN